MQMYIPIYTQEVQTSAEYAGMTQVVNVSNKTILVTEGGQYMRPREVAMVNSRSLVLESCIRKGWLKVLGEVAEASEPIVAPVVKKKKTATVAEEPVKEEVVDEPTEEVIQDVSMEVTPGEQEESL